jgi:hypothetical protein
VELLWKESVLRIVSITGVAPPPLGARKVKRGMRYEVFVYTSTGGKSLDLFAFRIDENGNVRKAPWLRI